MSYIKIYPKKLTLAPLIGTQVQAHEQEFAQWAGKVFYDIEQYGELHQNKSFDVLLLPEKIQPMTWSLQPTREHPEIKSFDAFLKSLNQYLFSNLKISIESPEKSQYVNYREVNLREVYFSLDTESTDDTRGYSYSLTP